MNPQQERNRCRYYHVLAALISFWSAMASNWSVAQNADSTGVSASSRTNAPAVYEVGDVYLPSSRVYVRVGKTGFGHEHGIVGQIKRGHINLAAATDAGGLEFDMASFSADTPDARKFVGLAGTSDASTMQEVTTNMRGPDVLDTTRFPTASFTIKEIARLPNLSQQGRPQYQLKGDFWLHGVSRPIQVVTEAEEVQGWIRLRGGFNMLQSQFGIRPFSKAFGAVGVTDALSVWGDLWIARERQVAAREAAGR